MAEHPKDAYGYCPRCGAAECTPCGSNGLACPACEFCCYYNVAAAVDVIIRNSPGEILLARRARDPLKGRLDLPGGLVGSGESLEDAARREVLEEVSLTVRDLAYLGSFPNAYAFGDIIYGALDVILTATTEAKTLTAGDDVASAQFLCPESVLLGEVGLESTRAALKYYLSGL
ncbi:MAG: NUDIX domain-containing protein [Myxococcales bacterium]|nr:NUDIX domain-containing protein [Myxococcales bacterium]